MKKVKVNLDVVAMEKAYVEMGEINLEISNYCLQAENEGEVLSEMVAKKGSNRTEEERFSS